LALPQELFVVVFVLLAVVIILFTTKAIAGSKKSRSVSSEGSKRPYSNEMLNKNTRTTEVPVETDEKQIRFENKEGFYSEQLVEKEMKVLGYLKQHGHRIRPSRDAGVIGMSEPEVRQALQGLRDKGIIRKKKSQDLDNY